MLVSGIGKYSLETGSIENLGETLSKETPRSRSFGGVSASGLKKNETLNRAGGFEQTRLGLHTPKKKLLSNLRKRKKPFQNLPVVCRQQGNKIPT